LMVALFVCPTITTPYSCKSLSVTGGGGGGGGGALGGGRLSGHILRWGSKALEFSNEDRYVAGVKALGTKATAATATGTEPLFSLASFVDADGFDADGLGAFKGVASCPCETDAKDNNPHSNIKPKIPEKSTEEQSFGFICCIFFRTVRPH
jgi:hypothetical protein